jgi:alkanesulfonate monooxygenase SsuD/methylene tetrahydromethanopterin reductase-like flavin-dependent oxidoreductase (luciferase family)
MKRAIYTPPMGTMGDVNLIVELAVAAEEKGWDGFFLWDHIRYERPVPFVDPQTTLGAIAAATNRIRIGALVTPLARRRPHKVAREVVSLDHLSGGRAVLGVGLGIDGWGEFSAFNEPADDDKSRARLLDEGIDKVIDYMAGELLPKPVQQPRVPIWSAVVLGLSTTGPIRRAARVDGVMSWKPDGPTTGDDVRRLRERIGRHDDGYDVVLAGEASMAADYEAAGVTWLCESFWPECPVELAREMVERGP